MKTKWVYFLSVALFFCGVEAHSLTLAEARTEVRRLIKDTATSTTLQRYSDSTLLTFINQAQREVVNQTWCLVTSTNITLTPNVTYYSMPNDMIAAEIVRFKDQSGRTRKLLAVSYKSLYETNPDFEKQTGPPMNYTSRFSLSGRSNREMAFLPIPTSASTGIVTMDYYSQSVDLVNDSDVLLNGIPILVPYHEGIVYQAVSKIKTIEGDATMAGAYLTLYQGAVTVMNSRLGEIPDYAPGFSAGNVQGQLGNPGKP